MNESGQRNVPEPADNAAPPNHGGQPDQGSAIERPGQARASQHLEWSVQQHSGPLPHPEILAAYNAAVTNGAERVFVIFEEQARHRMRSEAERLEIEKKVAQSNIDLASTGLIMAFLLCILFLGVAAFLILHGYQIAGTILGVGDLASLAAVFIGNRRQPMDGNATKRTG